MNLQKPAAPCPVMPRARVAADRICSGASEPSCAADRTGAVRATRKLTADKEISNLDFTFSPASPIASNAGSSPRGPFIDPVPVQHSQKKPARQARQRNLL